MTIEERVCAKIQQRREIGLAKYKTSMERTDLTELEWLHHFQQENLDAAIYAEKMIQMKEGQQ